MLSKFTPIKNQVKRRIKSKNIHLIHLSCLSYTGLLQANRGMIGLV